jgi:hypothetical protein
VRRGRTNKASDIPPTNASLHIMPKDIRAVIMDLNKSLLEAGALQMTVHLLGALPQIEDAVVRAVRCSLRRRAVIVGLNKSLVEAGAREMTVRKLRNVMRRRAFLSPLGVAVSKTLFKQPRRSPQKPRRGRRDSNDSAIDNQDTTESSISDDDSSEEEDGDEETTDDEEDSSSSDSSEEEPDAQNTRFQLSV